MEESNEVKTQSDDNTVGLEKKVRPKKTEKQMESFKKAQETRKQNIINKKLEEYAKLMKDQKTPVSDSSDDEPPPPRRKEPKERKTIVKPEKKPEKEKKPVKKPTKKPVVYESSESESLASSDSEEEESEDEKPVVKRKEKVKPRSKSPSESGPSFRSKKASTTPYTIHKPVAQNRNIFF